ncbi:Uma2 family endonuclease [Streptomyces catenulae]|uniref:Uma2 family endonuclease n=1 Tax=Streptomyces catenulae TaxID=66875 RepID=A0ABV2YXQ7_9ACTN|nr:Uma2 family endonuclease [Streptomyces catenulae]
MTVTYEPTATDQETLLEYFLGLAVPRGCRAEIIEGQIVVAPPAGGDREDCLSTLIWQFIRFSATEMDVSENKGLVLPGRGRYARNHVVPDATVAPRRLRHFRGAPPWMPPDGISLAIEVTGSTAHRVRIDKRHCCARGALPHYLLVDRETATTTLFSDPSGDDYRESHSVAFGKPLPLPAPFSFTLETGDFL